MTSGQALKKIIEKHGDVISPINFNQAKRKEWAPSCTVPDWSPNSKDKAESWVISFTSIQPSQPRTVQDAISSLVSFCVVGCYRHISRRVGLGVTVSDAYKGLPMLVRANDEPVFLFQIVDAIDNLIRYDDVIKELPGLSYTQIHSSMQFLRQITQFNTAGIDIDQVEDEWNEGLSEEVISELRSSLAQGEPRDVLTARK